MKITWEKGDTFSHKKGYGIVVSDIEAVLIDPKKGVTVTREPIPEKTFPVDIGSHQMSDEIRIAFHAVCLAINATCRNYDGHPE